MLRFGTVSSITSSTGDAGVAIVADGDPLTSMPVDYWTPTNRPAVNDRVLYDIVGGNLVVLTNTTRPHRVYASSAAFTPSALNTHYTTAVTYPANFFNGLSTPYVMLDVVTTAPEQFTVSVSGPTSSGASINFVKLSGTVGVATVVIFTVTQN